VAVPTTTATITPGGFSLALTTALTEGLHTIEASIANNAGRGYSPGWKFTVDTISPTVVLTATAGSGRNIALSWLGSDPLPTSGNLTYDVQYKLAGGRMKAEEKDSSLILSPNP
jgi:hypothetical protein